MNLDFSSEIFKERALLTSSVNYENSITSVDAFFVVLKGLEYDVINNLCEEVKNILCFKDSYKIYEFIQNDGCNYEFKKIVLDTAYNLIHSNKTLGTKEIDGRNSSLWISHSLYEGELASYLAKAINLDSDTAQKLGILHDIGRKFNHTVMHTIKGYEYLLLKGMPNEAICSLTHSFLPIEDNGLLKGNRCCNCDESISGFYVNNDGKGVFKDNTYKDDITLFLENYNYNSYDIILNISDLMATSSKITSPYERVQDIYSRRKIDPVNSKFFKISFINLLRKYLYSITKDIKYLEIYNINNVDNVEKLFIDTSEEFMQLYNSLIKENKNTIKL